MGALSDLWLLLRVPGVGPVRARQWVEYFGDPSALWEAGPEEWALLPHMGDKIMEALRQAGRKREEAARQVEEWEEQGLRLLSLWDEEYPSLLRRIPDAPPLLFLWGALRPEDACAVAIVGSRQATAEGMEWARGAAAQLAQRGLTVVSGLALGIDGAAHEGALQVGGRTIGVLGSGHARLFPPEHRELAHRIAQQGAVLSELDPLTPVHVRHLMNRDRIISGLARAVIVVEAAEGSGSMDTARKALRHQRRLYAVQWPTSHPGTEGLELLLARHQAHPLPAEEEPDWEVLVAEILAPRPFEKALQGPLPMEGGRDDPRPNRAEGPTTG